MDVVFPPNCLAFTRVAKYNGFYYIYIVNSKYAKTPSATKVYDFLQVGKHLRLMLRTRQ